MATISYRISTNRLENRREEDEDEATERSDESDRVGVLNEL